MCPHIDLVLQESLLRFEKQEGAGFNSDISTTLPMCSRLKLENLFPWATVVVTSSSESLRHYTPVKGLTITVVLI